MITGDGVVCGDCYAKGELARNELRATIAQRLQRGEPENAFGDATFDGKKRKRAVALFVAAMVLLMVLWGMRLARVL